MSLESTLEPWAKYVHHALVTGHGLLWQKCWQEMQKALFHPPTPAPLPSPFSTSSPLDLDPHLLRAPSSPRPTSSPPTPGFGASFRLSRLPGGRRSCLCPSSLFPPAPAAVAGAQKVCKLREATVRSPAHELQQPSRGGLRRPKSY